MKTHLSDILPRLKKYSQSLDQTAMLVDKPWVVNAGNNEYQKLIFKRDGTVLLSRNGNLTDGKWEYISGANALVIDYGSNKILYRHSYFDEAVLALQKDGPIKENDDSQVLLLANEITIPDANAIMYLKKKYYEQENVISISIANEEQLLLKNPYPNSQAPLVGLPVFEDSDIKFDGQYMSACRKIRYLIKDKRIAQVETKVDFGDGAYIWTSNDELPRVGDEVIDIDDGNYVMEIDYHKYKIVVKNGRIDKLKFKFW
jgi:hypothetical protein